MTLFDSVRQDLGYALRILRRSPGFTLAAVATLALGLGGSAAIYSVVDHVLIRDLPYGEPDRLFRLYVESESTETGPFSGPEFLDLERESESFAAIGAAGRREFTLTGVAEPERLQGFVVSPGFLEVFGTEPILGRTLNGAEPGERLAVLGHELWQSRFGGRPDVIGTTVSLDGEPYAISGVMPAGFAPIQETDLWTLQKAEVPESPFPAEQELERDRSARYLFVVARLRPGIGPDAAAAELDLIQRRWEDEYGSAEVGGGMRLADWREEVVGESRRSLLLLAAAVAVVLAITCSNLTNLLLARNNGRRRETTIRLALGAGRRRLIRQFVTETLLLSLFGAVAGLGLAYLALRPLQSLLPASSEELGPVALDLRVLLFTAVTATVVGILIGIAPALRAAAIEIGSTLRSGSRGAGTGSERHRLQALLVTAQVGLSLVLLVGAGLLIRTLIAVTSVDPGFRAEGAYAATLTLPQTRYAETSRQTAFWTELLPRLRENGAIESVGAGFPLPLAGSSAAAGVAIEGYEASPEEQPVAGVNWISRGFLETLGIPLVSGRRFTEADHIEAPPVLLVNESMAERYWPGADPVGKRLKVGTTLEDPDQEFFTVAGVVGDVRPESLTEEPEPQLYLHHMQNPWPGMLLVFRTGSDPTGVVREIRGEIAAIDPDLPLDEVDAVSDLVARAGADYRERALLISAFAALALVLVAVGVYGVVAFAVTQRTREIGIRMAIGADRGDVMRHFAWGGISPVLFGMAVGLAASFAMLRVLRSLLFGVPAVDLVTFAGVVLLIGLTAGAAVLVPARRATRVDPSEALRAE